MLLEVYGVGFTELGFAITVFSVTTAFTQAPIGFLVDRYGARTILLSGLALESLAFGLIGFFPLYGALLALMALAGLANAVYHPADYAILNASVGKSHIGRAFSIHTFAGYLGQAVAPVTMIFLMSFMDWRAALALCGLAGLIVAVVMKFNSEVLRDATGIRRSPGSEANGSRAGLGLLFSLPVLMGLLFFVGIAMSGHGIHGFSVSALHLIYETPITEIGFVLSAYLFASPIGVLVGGWVADHTQRHDLNAALCFVISGSAIFMVAALELSSLEIAGLFIVAGFFVGVVAPSRDMLIRAVTPPEDMGKVFGFVSTGFNIGGVIAPVMFGYLLDHGEPRWVFWAAGMLSFLTVATVLTTGRVGRRAGARVH